MRIDSHQHFWNYSPQKQDWMSDEMGVIKKDFLPIDLKPHLDLAGLDGCVAVQASQAETENAFLMGLAAENDFIKGIVGWVDLKADDLEERLAYYKQFEVMKGFRHVIHDEPDVNFMLDPRFVAGVGQLQKFDFRYDLLVFPVHLENSLQLVRALPEQHFVLDHIAKPIIKAGADNSVWKKQLQALAAQPNVCCKLSGMVTEATWNQWTYDDFVPFLDWMVACFSPSRLMYGSDWPVSNLSASYQNMYDVVQRYFTSFSQVEQEQVFGATAQSFYKLS